ncbi:hypothetical protein EDB83DRAFT_2504588 [Lactarius deliciosus]|nr:hypothetical protein EDB83DRAFT_2504588 [Lactarius deliciosus]
MRPYPFAFVCPSTQGISLALTRHLLVSTRLPVYATYRSGSPDEVARKILSPLKDMDESRLTLIPLDLTREDTIKAAAQQLANSLPKDRDPYLHTAFMTGGVLHTERKPTDLDADIIKEMFGINSLMELAWRNGCHISARLGSVTDNKRGGWYSYRASKAALNQVIKTFDLHLQQTHSQAICVGIHPGTVKTNLSKPFWNSAAKENLIEPDFSARRIVQVVEKPEHDEQGKGVGLGAGKKYRQ